MPRPRAVLGDAERDIVALGIAIAAIILFVGTGSTVVPQAIRSLIGHGQGPDQFPLNALLLNIALIIFGWRRYRQLLEEVKRRRHAEEQAHKLARTDPLTGLLNKRAFDGAVLAALGAGSSQRPATALMLIDLDNFKQINDFHGHNAGDRILIDSARRICDVLPQGTLLARIGGDEFACIVTFDTARAGFVDQLANSIIAAICQPSLVENVRIEITASIGIARSDMLADAGTADDDAARLFKMADVAMYHAKRQGRNCFAWFEAQTAREVRFRAELEAGIRAGIATGEFVPYYQQQIDLQTGRLSGFEMLARWHSPVFGVIGPDVFIPVAEQIGAIGELSESVISQALEDARRWDPELSLAVNISPQQMRDPWFAQKLLKVLTRANFPPDRLEIEITESCLHANITAARTLIVSLRNQGIRITIDDFGTGSNSLTLLRSLPFDRIKIDRSFVIELTNNTDSAAIVDAIALVGKGLKLPLTAAGIETAEILERLRQYGDIKGQGYYYGPPQPADVTQEWLASRKRQRGCAAEDIPHAPCNASPFAGSA